MEFRDYLNSVKVIPSTTTLEECAVVFNMVRDLVNPQVVIETGTGLGRMTLTIALALNARGFLYTVDSYQDGTRYGAEVQTSWNLDAAKTNVAAGGVINNVAYLTGDSLDILKSMPSNSADFIYLDGGHKYTFVVQEIAEALRVLKSGGTLAGHDFHPGYGEGLLVMKAVMEKFIVQDDTSRLKLNGRIWSVIK